MDVLDKVLNKFPMYKIVLFGLLALFLIALVYSFFGIIFYTPEKLISTFLILIIVCFAGNFLVAKYLKIPANPESSIITALILFFILVPIRSVSEVWIYVLAGLLAIGSKYILAIHKKHIFNPAAFSLVAIGFLGLPQISWWVGNSDLFPFVLVIGLLIVRKVRKLLMFSVYFIFALISISAFAFMNNREVLQVLIEAIFSYPILFLGTVMLVEPLTTPPRRNNQLIYGGIVGILSGAQYHIGPIFSSPELGLLIGNVYSYFVSFKERLALTFIDKKILAPGIYELSFSKNIKFSFTPGQYMEWTLGGVRPDMRGVRRFFTISSSPTEENIKIGIKVSERGSKFKERLMGLGSGEKIYAGNLAGDFTLPKKSGKFVFIAGGIGVTPFRSIIKNALDKNEKLDAILIYSCSSNGEFVYEDLFRSAEKVGLKTIYVCSHPRDSWKGIKGRINPELIKKEVPDYRQRTFYLSGPNVMVYSFKKILGGIGIGHREIVTDYFSGY